ncbi:MAG: D-arabinose 5-phosphate isomerase [Legionellales bacterium]|nr:D-arabinose 5-phosphate isomerase [Legionellales bacterium]
MDRTMLDRQKICGLGLAVIETEGRVIQDLASRIDDNFAHACEILMACEGRIVVIGMGKSGHIGGKIAATLASTGSPAFFVHPGEASHGDLGMITRKDVVIALSNSGKTPEILTILPLIKRLNVPFIALTGNPRSELSRAATVNIDISVEQEACPLGLAPTSSTTAALVMGDALAIALLEARGFTAEDFALSHPGGSLGRRLLLKVDDVMRTGERVPTVKNTASIRDALIEMTLKGLGMTSITDDEHKLLGIYTDGDLRRTLDKDLDLHNTRISEVMTASCKTIQTGILAAEALQIMESFKITSLMIIDDNNTIIGAVHMHDLLSAGVM